MPFLILVFLFVVIPIAEISLLIQVGDAIGGFKTILFVIATAILGAYLVRQQGLSTLYNLQKESQAGRLPAMQIGEGVLLLFAGAVLLTPGFITDAIGFSLLVPQFRRALVAWVANKGIIQAQSNFNSAQQGKTQQSGPSIIEGEFKDHQ